MRRPPPGSPSPPARFLPEMFRLHRLQRFVPLAGHSLRAAAEIPVPAGRSWWWNRWQRGRCAVTCNQGMVCVIFFGMSLVRQESRHNTAAGTVATRSLVTHNDTLPASFRLPAEFPLPGEDDSSKISCGVSVRTVTLNECPSRGLCAAEYFRCRIAGPNGSTNLAGFREVLCGNLPGITPSQGNGLQSESPSREQRRIECRSTTGRISRSCGRSGLG